MTSTRHVKAEIALMRLTKVEKLVETKMFGSLELALCQTQERRELNRNYDEAYRRRSGVHRGFVSHAVCTSPFMTLTLTQPFCTFQVIKGNEKRRIIFLYISVFILLPPCKQYFDLHKFTTPPKRF